MPLTPHRGVADRRRCHGFSLIELLVSIGIIVVLTGLILALVGTSRTAAQSVSCTSRLHSIQVGFTAYAHDNGDRFPDPYALNQSWEGCLHRYISTAQAFQCPSDQELYPAVGSSFDWRDTGVDVTTLAGKTVHDTNRFTAVLAFECLPGWHGKGRMNAALMDGSARTMSQTECLSDLQSPIRATP